MSKRIGMRKRGSCKMEPREWNECENQWDTHRQIETLKRTLKHRLAYANAHTEYNLLYAPITLNGMWLCFICVAKMKHAERQRCDNKISLHLQAWSTFDTVEKNTTTKINGKPTPTKNRSFNFSNIFHEQNFMKTIIDCWRFWANICISFVDSIECTEYFFFKMFTPNHNQTASRMRG